MSKNKQFTPVAFVNSGAGVGGPHWEFLSLPDGRLINYPVDLNYSFKLSKY